MGLRRAIGAVRAGRGAGGRLLVEFRRAVVLVPRVGADGLLTADYGGVRWLYAFTTPRELAAFAVTRGRGEQEWEYLTVRGERLLDLVVPVMGVAAGIAVDVAGRAPMMFPPVAGVVPAEAVVSGAGEP